MLLVLKNNKIMINSELLFSKTYKPFTSKNYLLYIFDYLELQGIYHIAFQILTILLQRQRKDQSIIIMVLQRNFKKHLLRTSKI